MQENDQGTGNVNAAAQPVARRSTGTDLFTILLGLGANIGEPRAQLRAAIARLSSFVRIDAVSDVYLTEPVGVKRQPHFHNLVLRGSTDRALGDLFVATQSIERELGRTSGVRYGPRLIDIDLLAYGNEVLSSERLVVPHPWLHRRTFVLVPLMEIAPEWRHPVFDETAEEMLGKLHARTAVDRVGPLEPWTAGGPGARPDPARPVL